jgi:hypothetical protein
VKNPMAPNIVLTIVLFAAVAAVALRAVARRPAPPEAPRTGPAPVTVMTGQSQPPPAAATGTHDGAGGEMARPPAPPGRLVSTVDQAQNIFHELHAYGRSTFCTVCDSQYASA